MRRTVPVTLAILGLVMTLGACASSGAGTGNATRLPDRITSAEIAATNGTSAYELISQLRPRWLRPANTGSLNGLQDQVTLVYVDGHKMGGLDTLKSIGAAGIVSMQYLDAIRAATTLPDAGSDPTAGAIMIITGH